MLGVRTMCRSFEEDGALRLAVVDSDRLLTSFALQDIHLATVTEILQTIRQSDMSPLLSRIYQSEGGTELLDVLMKYLYALSPLPPSRSPSNPLFLHFF